MSKLLLASHSIKGALRVAQTSGVLASTGARWLLGDRPPTPKLMRQTFEKLGSTYIKLGQFIASSPSIFPMAYVEEFQHCLDQTKPLPFSVMEKVIRKELDAPIDSVFAEINPEPLASASIAQVYAARLLTGEDVVIKVQKPGVENILLTDLNFLYASSRIMEMIAPQTSRASISGIIQEIQRTMMEECDFYKEAKNLEIFARFLEDSGNQNATVPKVYPHASTMRLLTMERLYGVPLTDLESIRKYSDNPEQTLITAMNTWFDSLMGCEFFHADVHAGNLMVLRDGRIGFIDFGIVGRIRKETWTAMASFMTSIAMGDFPTMASAMATIGITKDKVDVDTLATDLEKLYSQFNYFDPSTLMNGNVDEDDINRVMLDIVALGERHGIRFPREFALLLKQFLYFDRYTRILSPDMNFIMDERVNMLPEGFMRH